MAVISVRFNFREEKISKSGFVKIEDILDYLIHLLSTLLEN